MTLSAVSMPFIQEVSAVVESFGRVRGSFAESTLDGVHDKVGEFAGRAVHEWFGEVFAVAGGRSAFRTVSTHDPRRT